jgi:hypothetical protein
LRLVKSNPVGVGPDFRNRANSPKYAGGRLVAAPAVVGPQGAHEQRPLVGQLGPDHRLRQAELLGPVAEPPELGDPQGDVLGRGRYHRSHEPAVPGQVHDRDVVAGQHLQGLGRHLDVAERDHLPDGCQRDAVELGAVLLDDEVLAPLADERAGLLEVNHRPVVRAGDDAGDAGRWAGLRRGVRPVDLVERLLRLADGDQGTAVTLVPLVGGQRLRRRLAGRQLPAGLDRVPRLIAQGLVELDDDALAGAGTELLAAGDVRMELLFEEHPLGAELDGVVVPDGGVAVGVPRGAAALGLDGVDPAADFFHEIELGSDAEPVAGERDGAGPAGVAVLAGLVLQLPVVDPAVLEQPILDVLVGRHHPLDVLEEVEPGAVGDLVEGPDGDQVERDGAHGASSPVDQIVPARQLAALAEVREPVEQVALGPAGQALAGDVEELGPEAGVFEDVVGRAEVGCEHPGIGGDEGGLHDAGSGRAAVLKEVPERERKCDRNRVELVGQDCRIAGR